MKKLFLLFIICIITFNFCKQEKVASSIEKGGNSINISKEEYDSLFAGEKQIKGLFPSNLAKYAINDTLAREFVQKYLTNIFGYIRKNMERSVFFTFDEITSTIHDEPACSALKNYGFRVYFAEYTDSDNSKKYLEKKFLTNFEDYIGKQTAIIQIMNKTNDTFISYRDDLLNYNLGELCPPCLSSNNASGLGGDWYIQD